ncbi:MAG: hypothetical protein KBC94_00455 [Pseudacidovorax sp.]|uniref:hypothetical protein n=1 Tax=Pseudacidovorax sp. TaxID=1934311 RepID=UPI001B63164A|nr:hypothetical protein [Pseudacidovorax sp.]MBP6892866.1 hypothetical protein [Pseudacidovorax sp.]
MNDESDSPEKVALVIGIPISIEECALRLRSPVPWEYGERTRERDRAQLGKFSALYEVVGEAAADLFATASAAKATIYRCATFADLKAALSSHDAVIVLAHWRGSSVSSLDLLPGWNDRFQALLKWSGPRSDAFRSVRDGWSGSSAESFCESLNRAINGGAFRACFPSGAAQLDMSPLLGAAMSRDIVDQAFDPHLRKGNALELFDGMWSGQAIVGAIPRDFRGTLDLSCCTSSVLATNLRVAYGDALTVISNDESIPPDYQMRVIEGGLWLLNRRRPAGDYASARREVSKGLGDWRAGSYRSGYL